MGRLLLPKIAAEAGRSGVLGLPDGREALAARVYLIRSAEVSIDVQYYIWKADTTGWVLLDELRAAAERGVRVRLLLDDNGISGFDRELAALDGMEGVEVRLWNPFTLRAPKLLSFAFDFPRLNRRMHNKSLTVDGIVTIVGGRNIGDIYFSYGPDTHFFDLDVLAAGPAAEDVSGDFDAYWSSASSYPADRLLPEPSLGPEAIKAAADVARASVMGTPYVEAIRSSPIVEGLRSGSLPSNWVRMELISDDPAKGLGEAADESLLIGRLSELVGRPERSLDIVSAYFIPGLDGAGELAELASNGVETRLLTNSLESTDVPAVHSAYQKYREDLLDAGVRMLELRSTTERSDDGRFQDLVSGSLSSLHAKTFAVDGERIFIGSFNFDPRSAHLNTEMGFLIESPEMAEALSAHLDRTEAVYELRKEDDEIEWVERGGGVTFDSEPRASLLRRASVRVLGWLPIEWML